MSSGVLGSGIAISSVDVSEGSSSSTDTDSDTVSEPDAVSGSGCRLLLFLLKPVVMQMIITTHVISIIARLIIVLRLELICTPIVHSNYVHFYQHNMKLHLQNMGVNTMEKEL